MSQSVLCNPVCFDHPFGAIEGLLRKLLDVCLPRCIVRDGVFVGICRLGLSSAQSAIVRHIVSSSEHRTCSSLSIKVVV